MPLNCEDDRLKIGFEPNSYIRVGKDGHGMRSIDERLDFFCFDTIAEGMEGEVL